MGWVGGYSDSSIGPFLGIQILNFNIFGFFRKMNIFGGEMGVGIGYDDTVDIFRGPLQYWTIFGRYFYTF